MKLYFFPPSPNSRRAHAVALHLNLPSDFKLVNLQAGEQRTPEFLKLNPTGRIPVLQDRDFILWESNAIMQYLASQVETTLWPNDVKSRADIMRWQSWQLSHWAKDCQPIQFERSVKQVLNMGEPDEKVIARATDIFHAEATVLNEHLATREYLVNDTLTLADFAVASDLTYAAIAQFPLENYPHIRNWYARIEGLPAWQQTAPQQ
ncbi:MAG: glutathione S-transferase family protein [Cyanobacteria bacterium P01_F01_bin.53]